MIADFLIKLDRPLLLGLSGGPDSMALFHLLLEQGIEFEAAHLDHGWRPESGEEATVLAEMCQKRGVSFHLRMAQLEGSNLEDRSRQARLTFFKEICAKKGLKGVMLAHHADDQAETVLKRVFEGASLPKLRGLAAECEVEGLKIYRPLLHIPKNELVAWLQEQNIPYFLDPTNENERFLRNRMRKTLLPTLSQQFGKEVKPSLCRLGEAAHELTLYLAEVLEPMRAKVIKNEKGAMLDFTPFLEQNRFILKAVIRDLFESEKLALPKNVLETILLHIQQRSALKRVKVGKKTVEIERGILTIKSLNFSLDREYMIAV